MPRTSHNLPDEKDLSVTWHFRCRNAGGRPSHQSPSNRLAFHIEQDLLDGSLETDLEREVEVICKELERRKTEWRAAALATTETLIGELRSDIYENEEKDR